MEKYYRVFAWVGFACEAALILRQIFGPSHLFSSPGNALTIILVDALPILIFLTVMLSGKRRGVCLTAGILCILWTFVEAGAICLHSTLALPMIPAILPRALFEALPAILIGIALILFAAKRRFPYVGWFATGAAVLYWLYGIVGSAVSSRISGPAGRMMAWPFPLMDIVYLLLAFAVQGMSDSTAKSGLRKP